MIVYKMTSIGLGCGRHGCTCEYCNGDNYDRYIGDHLRNILDELNTYLHSPVSIDDDKIKGNEEIYYSVIMDQLIDTLREQTNQET